ncbi:peptidase m16 inactive domain protein [Ichthyophthirius multifiliis]|uniref:Peptidase m16 inactive domain protein n=1 Tax=Ichthyophthirius multifiliis TaxID=5932 RepID=G0QPE6_ICHMU|nr:peptidase m16 inactive domain protein [Ichthyophthirius multifiliis]EGR32914.1 peptidase m16 inactive domain protein [Ichthyophthirius multifiliis]|eukprot:XP_004036900.1 peptidase m16 inactive domain protein [Ichthyophthirius multifiliis]
MIPVNLFLQKIKTKNNRNKNNLKGFSPIFKKDQNLSYQLTKLDNGIQILTENGGFPFHSDIGLLVQVGTRNEETQTGGAIKMLNHLHFMSENALENYELNQQNGGGLVMSSDHETTYFKCSCVESDIEQMFDLMLKTSIQTKDFSIFKPDILEEQKNQIIFEEQILKAAFGGNSSYFSAANVPSHKDFVDLVQEKLRKYPEFLQRKFTENKNKTVYVGNDLRINQDAGNGQFQVGIGFKSINWNHQDVAVIQVLLVLLGNSSYFSTGGPGKGMHCRTTKNLLNKFYYIQGADSISNIFTDGGLFALKVSGFPQNEKQLLNSCINEIKLLTQPINDIEVQRSKNILKSLISLSLERQQDRLEEVTKHILNFKQIKLNEINQIIENVTGQDINRVVKNMIANSRPTVTIIGEGANNAPSFDYIAQSLLQI